MKKILISLAVLLSVILVPTPSLSQSNQVKKILLTGDNTLVLNSEVDGDSVSAIIMKARQLDNKLDGLRERLGHKRPLYLYLNSPGGSVTSGMELIEALKGLGRPVNTVVNFGASMAFQLTENLGTRFILKSGVLMSHRAMGQFVGSFGGTHPSQLDSRIRLWTEITKELDENTVARTNGKQTLESYQKAYNQELWMTGQEAIDGGYADQIVEVKCAPSLNGVTTHQVQFMGLTIQYDLDNCPLNTTPMNIRVANTGKVDEQYVDKIKEEFNSSYRVKMNTPIPMVY